MTPDISENPTPRRRLQVTRVADVEERPINWLWPGRIALGKLTLFQGDPSVGKSTVTLDIAARVTRGSPWPDRADLTAPTGDVLLLSAEDSVADTIRPRLRAAGADLSRVHAIDGVRNGRSDHLGAVTLGDHLADLEAELLARPETRLLIVDPISAYMGSVDSHSNADVRGVLAPLSGLADRFGVALIAVTHMNKGTGGKAIYRATGSLAFVAAARAAWSFSRDTGDRERCIMSHVKNNIAVALPGLAYRMAGDPPRIEWDPEPVNATADELLAEESGESGRSELDDAVDFLRATLAQGPMPSNHLYERAKAAGISKSTLKRAKKSAGAEARLPVFQGEWTWSLPQSGPKEPEKPIP